MPRAAIAAVSADRKLADRLAAALEARGVTVSYLLGERQASGIARKSPAADAAPAPLVVVIWSESSVRDENILKIAREAARRDALAPILVDHIDIPQGFRQAPTFDMTRRADAASIAIFADNAADFLGVDLDACRQSAAFAARASNRPSAATVFCEGDHEAALAERTVTGRELRMRLFVKSLIFALLFGAAAAGFGYGLGFDWRAWTPAAAAVLVAAALAERTLAFLADSRRGAASLSLFSSTQATIFCAGLIAAASFVLAGRADLAVLSGARMSAESIALTSVSFDPYGDWLVTASDDGEWRVWSARTGERISAPPRLEIEEAARPIADFGPREGEIAIAAGRRLQIVDAASGAARLAIDDASGPITALAFHPDQPLIAAAEGAAIRIRDVETGEILAEFDASAPVRALDFAPAGDFLVAAGEDGAARIWGLSDNALVFSLRGHDAPLAHAAFDAAGRRIATADTSGRVVIWTAATGEQSAALSMPAPATSVEFIEEGARLAIGGADGVLRVADAETGAILRSLDAHDGALTDLAAAPGGRRFASVGEDNRIRLWSAEGARPARTFGHERPAIRALARIERRAPLAISRGPESPIRRDGLRALGDYALDGAIFAAIILAMAALAAAGLRFMGMRRAARAALAGVTGAGALYFGALILATLPATAFAFWIFAGAIPALIIGALWLGATYALPRR